MSSFLDDCNRYAGVVGAAYQEALPIRSDREWAALAGSFPSRQARLYDDLTLTDYQA